MSKRKYILKLAHNGNRFTGKYNGLELELNEISKTIDEIQHRNVMDRRKFIIDNDNLEADQRLDISKLAETFGVCTKTILWDIENIPSHGIVSEAPQAGPLKASVPKK